ncbi:MAG: glycosyltransferase family 1 protein [Cyanobacteria bacterium SBLK]|nr:glycosyltransferase family 1 protein [Cyanobacteria bacterium SBLK]
MKIILQIVPTLPPNVDGLADYAFNLAKQLRQDFQILTHFIVGNPQWSGAREIDGFPVTQLEKRSPQSLVSQLDRNLPIFLNYEGYGYAKRGYPRWLSQGLEQWKKISQKPLITMFHEVYPYDCGPPWTSSFWLSPLQRKLAAKLLQISDRAITSKQSYADLLQQLSSKQYRDLLVLPVFCSIGEPKEILPLKQRQRRMIIFGHYNSRALVYRNNLTALESICRVLEIEEIYDIGVPTGLQLPRVNNTIVTEMGVTPASEISQLMLDSIAGFLSFIPPEYLAKSTVFASYCAHGLIPILTASSPPTADGLECDLHYYSTERNVSVLTFERGQYIADCAREWYARHNLPKQADAIAHLFSTIERN